MAAAEPVASEARDVLAEIVAAARALLAENGAADVRMQDVAMAAGISRAHLYNHVSGREALVELALAARCEEFGDALAARAAEAGGDIATAIVDQTLAGVGLATRDPEFGRLADALPRTRLAHLLTAADSPVYGILVRAFRPLLVRALDEGQLRTDVSMDRMYAWLQTLHGNLASRDDLSPEEQRALLEDFMLPSILV